MKTDLKSGLDYKKSLYKDFWTGGYEEKSNFGLTQILDPIGILGGRPIWDTNASSAAEKAAYQAQQEAKRQQQQQQQMMRDLAEREASSARAFEIRRQVAAGERSVKTKKALIVGGMIVGALAISGTIAYLILKKK